MVYYLRVSDRINVLHIITKLELGGAQKTTLSILEGLNKTKYKLFLISGTEGLLIGDALALKDVRIKFIKSLRREINPFFDALALYKLFWEIKKNKIAIVHTHSSKAGILGRWAARWARAPVIIHTIHGWSFNIYQSRFLYRLFILLERLSAKMTTRIVAVSNSDINKGLTNQIGSKNQYVLIRYGIDKKNFSTPRQNEANLRKEFDLSPESFVIGMVACYKVQKSPLDFIKVAHLVSQTLPNAQFLMVGDGELMPKVKALIKKFGLQDRFRLTGWRRDIERLMSLIDVVVLTSRWEGLPVVFLEAMMCAKAIVATSVDGIPEVIKEGERGFLVPPGAIHEMADRIITLLQDEKMRNEISQRNRDFVLNEFDFDVSYMVNKIDKLYESLN